MREAAGPGIVLVGMPASGKTSAGQIVAQRLGRPFVDTDALFEEIHAVPVPAYLAEHGEAAFREAEAAIVLRACAVRGAVIGAGGGALLDPLNRWHLWHHGVVAWLDVGPEELLRRLLADRVPRPTFQPYDQERLTAVLAQRLPYYRAADLRIDASPDPGRVAAAVIARRTHPVGRRLLDAEVPRHHPIGPSTARIAMGLEHPLDGATAGVAVRDPRASLDPPARATLPVRGGERSKRVRRLELVLTWLAEQRVERGETLFAVGGGTIGDLAGTAAALFNRGLPLVQVPTTWLAQADAAIGGKVAVDLPGAKNAVGAFWPPVGIHVDVASLRTLPMAHRREGMAESVKAALVGDPGLFRLLEERGENSLRADEAARYAIVERSIRLKLAICDRDPFEAGERRVLNLGHTIGHALEVESGYRLRHGSAVALGMRAVAAIAARRTGDATLAGRLDELLAVLALPRTRTFDPRAVREALGTDKKRRSGRQRWILPMEIGGPVEVDDVSDAEVRHALDTITAPSR